MEKKMFEGARVGDKVWHITRGKGKITNIIFSERWPIEVKFKNGISIYTFEGKDLEKDINPSLFWDEIEFDIPTKPKRKVKRYINLYWEEKTKSIKYGGYLHLTKSTALNLGGEAIKSGIEIEIDEE